jgi:hypothetical protein
LFDNKVIKNFLMGIALIFLVFGQFQLLSGGHMVSGIAFTLICVIIFFLALSNMYLPVIVFFMKIGPLFKALFAPKPKAPQPSGPAKVNRLSAAGSRGKMLKTDIIKAPAVTQEPKPNIILAFLKNMAANRTGIEFKFQLPKWVIFVLVVCLFGAAQYFFFKENLKLAILIFILDAALLISAFLIKGKALDVEFSIDSGLKILSLVSGAALVVIGWLLLISQSIPVEEWGVVVTIPGTILLFLGLPKSEGPLFVETDRSDILFLKPDFLNNYLVKGLLLVAAFFFVKAGVRVMQSPDFNMYSMLFYFAAGVCLFFAFPLFNFAEKQYDSRILDFIKFGVVIAALAIAYRGQTFFVKHDINTAVTHYFISAVLFIFAFPIYAAKEVEEKEVFPVKIEIIFLILITVIGAFLRFYEIDVRPFGIENDEAGGLTARMARDGATILNLPVGNFVISVHIVRIFIALFGGMTRIGIKMMPVLVGIIAIPVIYFFIRDRFNARVAIFVTVIFTFLRWNMHYSRYSSPVIMSICTEAMALYFFFKAIETKKKFIWFMAGLCIGITWHGPMTFFLFIVPFGLYLAITSLSKKKYFKANVIGMLAFMCGFWIFGSMILHNYFISKRIYFGRVAEVSVFSKDPNAPSKNVAKGIVDNTKQVLLMFNHMGDSRSRNSGGQPLEPTVDFLTSMLFAIGFLYALYYSKYWQFFIMLMVFFSQAAGSIFSIEAPSAMRAVGTMVPVLFFVAFTFDRIWMSVRRALGRKLEWLYLPVLMLVFLVPIAKENYSQYFERWIGGMDELSTAAGMYSAMLGNKTRIVLYTALYYPGHPPYKFFRWDYKVNSADRFTTGLVHLREITDENFAIFFHYDTWDNIDSIKRTMFPDAKITDVTHSTFNKKLKPGEGFGELLKVMYISNEQIQKARGLTGSYSFGGQPRPNEDLAFLDADNAKVPYNVTWKGDLLIPYYGKFKFVNKGTAAFGISIDGHFIAAGKDVLLGEGFHRITVTASRNGVGDRLLIGMESKTLDGNNVTMTEMINIDKKYLYNFPSFGLHGYYYSGAEWSVNPIRFEVMSTNMCFGGGGILTQSAIWNGTLNVPATGSYIISTRSNGYIRIIMDGRYYSESGNGDTVTDEKVAKYFAGRKLVKINGGFNLTAGRHNIEIYCMNSSLLELMWDSKAIKSPGPIPVDALEPDYQISKD